MALWVDAVIPAPAVQTTMNIKSLDKLTRALDRLAQRRLEAGCGSTEVIGNLTSKEVDQMVALLKTVGRSADVRGASWTGYEIRIYG